MLRALLTNDDGIEAPGLATLERTVKDLGFEYWVVAPADPVSECGHRVTTREPLRFEERGPGRYAVFGTPADCVRVALRHLAPKLNWTPDWTFSGINYGGNMGVDVYISGTAAAARESAILGVPSIALSNYRITGEEVPWNLSQLWARTVIEELLQKPQPEKDSFWNVNFPIAKDSVSIPDRTHCKRSIKPLPVIYETTPDGLVYSGAYSKREFEEGSDIAHCFGGNIVISSVDL